MKLNRIDPWALHRMQRLAVGIVGAGLGCAPMAVVTLLFAHASHTDWLTPTPHNLAGMQRCNATSSAAARQACVAALVATAKKHDSTQRVAQGDVGGGAIRTNP